MADPSTARQRRFDVDVDFSVPDAAGVLPKGGTLRHDEEEHSSEYFDTARRDLRQAGVSARRQADTAGVSWQLRVPHAPLADEIRIEGVAAAAPAELDRLLLGITDGEPLCAVTTLTTHRSVTRLTDRAGTALAVIGVETVEVVADGSAPTTWRDLQVELVGPRAPESMLDDLDRLVRRAGARPAGRALKQDHGSVQTAASRLASRSKQRSGRTAGAVVADYLLEQHRTLLAGDVALRRGDESAIHATRVATRRMRSAVRVFGRLFDHVRAEHLDAELRWYADLLGAVRDVQVLREHLHTLIRSSEDDPLMIRARIRVDDDLERERSDHRSRLDTEMSSPRYRALLREVAGWIAEPPWTGAAKRPSKSLIRMARRANRSVAARLKQADSTGDIDQLHRARKAAKRARYAAEAVEFVDGSRSMKHARRYERLQSLLGEHRDSIVAGEFLARIGAVVDDRTGFAFGVLHERAVQSADVHRQKAHRLARRYR